MRDLARNDPVLSDCSLKRRYANGLTLDEHSSTPAPQMNRTDETMLPARSAELLAQRMPVSLAADVTGSGAKTDLDRTVAQACSYRSLHGRLAHLFIVWQSCPCGALDMRIETRMPMVS